MNFQEIKISELENFINTTLYKNSKNIPITKQRAISQFHNPRADKDDIALIIATDKDKQIIGFIGALPDYIYDTKTKVYWNSCWWVDSKKGKHTAIPLFLNFLKTCNNKVMFRDMTKKTEQIIDKLNKFSTIKNLDGYRYFLKLNSSEIIPKKIPTLYSIKPFFKLVDFIFNSFLYLKKPPKKESYQSEKSSSIDEETLNFIQKFNKKELFKREKKELEWILDYPWVLKNSLKNKLQYYYFTDTSNSFNTNLIKVYKNSSELIGVLFLTNNNGLVKIPYVYFKQGNTSYIVQVIYQYLYKQNAISFLTYNKFLNDYIQKNRNPFWYKKKDNRAFVVSKSLVQHINLDFDFQDGEGDFVFT